MATRITNRLRSLADRNRHMTLGQGVALLDLQDDIEAHGEAIPVSTHKAITDLLNQFSLTVSAPYSAVDSDLTTSAQ